MSMYVIIWSAPPLGMSFHGHHDALAHLRMYLRPPLRIYIFTDLPTYVIMYLLPTPSLTHLLTYLLTYILTYLLTP